MSGSRHGSMPRPVVTMWLLVGAALLVLQGITRMGWVSPTILSAPTDVARSLWEIVSTAAFYRDFSQTIIETTASIAISIGLGVPVGLGFKLAPRIGRMFEPYLIGLYAMPLVLFYPFLLVAFGLGPAPIIIIASAMGIIPVIINSWMAFSNVPEIYYKVAAVVGCTGMQRFRRIILPAAAPLLFAGFKLSLIYSFVGVIVMEFMIGSVGLGFQIDNTYNDFKVQDMYAYVVIVVTLAAVFSMLMSRVENRMRREQ